MAEKKSFIQVLKSMGPEYYLVSGLLFFFFASWASCGSLLALWLNRVFNMNGTQIGFAYSVISVTALALAPVYGMIQDRLILKRYMQLWLGILFAGCAPIYILVIEPLLKVNVYAGSVVLGLYMGFAFQGGVGVLESYTERFGRVAGFEFGHAHMWGTLGWAAAVAFTGVLMTINPHYNFYVASIAGIIFLILLLNLKSAHEFSFKMLDSYRGSNNKKASLSEVGRLVKMPGFWAVIVWVFGASMYNVYEQQFMSYFASKFADKNQGTQMYGFLNSTQVFLSALCNFLAPFVVNKIGAKNGLLVASTIMFTRIGLSGLVDSAWAISFIKLLRAPEGPMMLIPLFKYITTRFNPALSSTLYLVAFIMMCQIMSAALAPVAGLMYDTLGFSYTYLCMSGLVFCTTALSVFFLSGKEERNSKLKVVTTFKKESQALSQTQTQIQNQPQTQPQT